jgi:hypothetical protein
MLVLASTSGGGGGGGPGVSGRGRLRTGGETVRANFAIVTLGLVGLDPETIRIILVT